MALRLVGLGHLEAGHVVLRNGGAAGGRGSVLPVPGVHLTCDSTGGVGRRRLVESRPWRRGCVPQLHRSSRAETAPGWLTLSTRRCGQGRSHHHRSQRSDKRDEQEKRCMPYLLSESGLPVRTTVDSRERFQFVTGRRGDEHPAPGALAPAIAGRLERSAVRASLRVAEEDAAHLAPQRRCKATGNTCSTDERADRRTRTARAEVGLEPQLRGAVLRAS